MILASRKRQTRESAEKSRRPAQREVGAAARKPRVLGLANVAPMLFFSGACALIFQVAWMRELRLVFGATTASVAAVLAVFMAGLGFGSAVLGRRADRAANPLRMYGQLETAVAVAVAATPLVIPLAAALYFRLGGQESLGLRGATFARLLLATVVMGVPTFLMGGTLPAAVRSITTAGDARRRGLAVLYGVNTLGAVCGAYFATFFALEFLGTRGTLWFGCGLNLLVGMIALSLAREMALVDAGGGAKEKSGGSLSLDPSHPGESTSSWLVYLTAAVLGFTFFMLELVWYRMLGPILGGTTFTFGLILCFALLGIGIGGACYHLVFRWVRPSWSVLALTCAAEAALAALPLALGDRLALFAGRWNMYSTTFFEVELGWSVVMSVVVLPVALVSGLQFPLLVALLGQGRAAVSRQLGMTYAWNTVGAIAGSLLGGFGALPLLTAPGTWRGVSLVLAALSVTLIARSWREWGRGSGRWAAGVAGLLLLTLVFVSRPGPTAVWRHSGIGAGRAIVPPADAVNATLMWCNEQRRNLLWEAEGIESSIGITAPDGLSFVVNGKNDGNAIGDAGTQIGVAIIGAMLHPDPKTGLVIGLGTGESAGWLASLREMERVDVVELEPAIDEMARRSSELNRNALENPKVRRIYNDGREHVLTTQEKYDVILSEPSNPYRAGVASLYTQEFYRALRDRLNPDGIFVQWVQAYEVDDFTVKTVLATARSVFDYVEIWQTIPGDLQIVCSQQPIEYSEAALRERVARPVTKEALQAAWRVNDLEGLLARYLGNSKFVDGTLQAAVHQPNTDDRNFLEYGFAKTVGKSMNFSSGEFRQAAMDAGQHRPPLAPENGVDWDLVERRRVEFNAVYAGDMAPFKQTSPANRLRIEAFAYSENGYYREALDKWSQLPPESLSEVERLFQARAHAELSEAKCLELIGPIAARFPAETAIVRGIYYSKQKDGAQTADGVLDAFESLARNPWTIHSFTVPLVKLSTVTADEDHATGRRIFELLGKPFASYRMEHQRVLMRLFVAESLGQEYVLEALKALEPHPPWMGPLLQMRADVYKTAKHPLADQARRDWDVYQRNAK